MNTRSLIAAAFLSTTCLTGPAFAIDATTLPTGGKVVSGQVTISQSPAQLDIMQSSQRGIINWQGFDVGSGATVNFAQPNANAVTLNRVTAGSASQIYGKINANGQVYLVNPSGVLFGKGAQVNVGGLVASTHNITDDNFNAGTDVFTRNGAKGTVENQGTINGNRVVLIGSTVNNSGAINANGGQVGLAAGEKVLLSAGAGGALKLEVDGATINTMVKNSGTISADGGQVILQAEAASAARSAVVSNTGEIRAKTMANKDGRILLLADMESGEVQVGGKLDASAPVSGNGGFIETSAAKVKHAADSIVTTKAANGKTGTYLVDPKNYTIAATGGDITGAQVSGYLASNNYMVATQSAGTENGDILVNDQISWNANTTLTLNAHKDILINQNITSTGSGVGAGLALVYAGDYLVQNGAKVTLSGANAAFSTNGNAYTVINNLTDLQAINTDGTTLAGRYVLGSDIDATATSGWNGGDGFVSIGDDLNQFTGQFAGLGHTVNGLTIHRGATNYTGLFGHAGTTSVIRDIKLTNVDIIGDTYTGGLVGWNYGTIKNASASGAVSGNTAVGILAGQNYGTLDKVSATGTADASSTVGGLVGYNNGTVSNASASGVVTGANQDIGGIAGHNTVNGTLIHVSSAGNVNGNTNTGGLLGFNNYGVVTDAHSTADVVANNSGGGLIGGGNGGTITNVSATGDLSSTWGYVTNIGGLMGFISGGTITDASATGDITVMNGQQIGGLLGGAFFLNGSQQAHLTNVSATGNVTTTSGSGYIIGGLIGQNQAVLTNGSATGNVSASTAQQVGGLVGLNNNGSITGSTATGNVSGGVQVGGLSGSNTYASIANSSATGTVTSSGTGDAKAGGLVGENNGATIDNSFATGNVVAVGDHVGGLVGQVNSGSITNSHASGNVSGKDRVGGLMGGAFNSGNISNVYATGNVTASGEYGGGLIGMTSNSTISNAFASGQVGGTNFVGGLIGAVYSGANLSNAYATGAVNGSGSNIGGLSGFNSGTIANTYASGAVTGGSAVGGLLGFNGGGLTSSYWNINTTGQATSGGGTGLTTAQMVKLASFSGWDIGANGGQSTVWRIYEGSSAPLLRSFFSAPLTVTAANASSFASSGAYSGGNGVTYSGPYNPAFILGTPGYGGNSQGAQAAGTYVIQPQGIYSSQLGYDLTFANGTLTMQLAPRAVFDDVTGKVVNIYKETTSTNKDVVKETDNEILKSDDKYVFTQNKPPFAVEGDLALLVVEDGFIPIKEEKSR